MGCGPSTANTVAPQSSPASAKKQTNSEVRRSDTEQTSRNGSGKSYDSGYGDHKTNSGAPKRTLPPIKSSNSLTVERALIHEPMPNSRKNPTMDEKEIISKLRKEGLIQRSVTQTNFGLSFEIVDDEKVVGRKPPARLAKLEKGAEKRKTITDEEIQDKLDQASRRKQAQESARLLRIRSLQGPAAKSDKRSSRAYDENDESNSYYLQHSEQTQSNRIDVQPAVSSANRKMLRIEEARRFDEAQYSQSRHEPVYQSPTKRSESQVQQDELSDHLYRNKSGTSNQHLMASDYDDAKRRKNDDVTPRQNQINAYSFVGRYADDGRSSSSKLDDYSRQAVKGILSSSQRHVDDTRRFETPERSYYSGRSRKSFEGELDERDKRIKSSHVDSGSDNSYHFQDRPASRISYGSVGSSDSQDFWNKPTNVALSQTVY